MSDSRIICGYCFRRCAECNDNWCISAAHLFRNSWARRKFAAGSGTGNFGVDRYCFEIRNAGGDSVCYCSSGWNSRSTDFKPYPFVNTTWVHMADKYAEEGNTRGIYLAGLLYPSLARIPITVTPVAVAVYFGAANIDKVLAVIPDWLMNGLTVAGGMLPALGFAIVIKIIGKKELLPYFVAGYFILKLSGIGILPLSIFGVIAAYLHIMFTNKDSGEEIANGTAN